MPEIVDLPPGPGVQDAVVDALVQRAGGLRGRPVVLIDGRSGAGKTELGRALAPRIGAVLVSLDDLYPGWDGLAAGARAVSATVLRRRDPGWTRWDWAESRPAEWHPIDRSTPLVIEGCGAITAASRRRAGLAVWIETDAEVRRARALARDGRAYEPHWDRWAAQEAQHLRRDRPIDRADVILRG